MQQLKRDMNSLANGRSCRNCFNHKKKAQHVTPSFAFLIIQNFMLPSSTVTNSAYSFVSNYQVKCSLLSQATVKRLGRKLDARAIPQKRTTCPPSLSLGARS